MDASIHERHMESARAANHTIRVRLVRRTKLRVRFVAVEGGLKPRFAEKSWSFNDEQVSTSMLFLFAECRVSRRGLDGLDLSPQTNM